MKLPILELKRMEQIINNRKNLYKLTRKKSLANFFLYPKNNISSIFSENKLKWEALHKDNNNSQRYTNLHNNTKSKLIDLSKARNEFFNNSLNKNKNNTNYLCSYNCKSSNKITSNEMDSTEEESSKINNYERYIKKTLNSFKIKKEISSFLYSSPDKQKRLINFLSLKFFKNNNNNDKINKNDEKNIKNNQLIKIKRKLIKEGESDKKEMELEDSILNDNNEYDEDKTNLKEFSLFSLFINKKKDKIQNRMKYMRNDKMKYIECWDNNLLKNILPKNLKSQSELNIKSSESNNKDNSFGSILGSSFSKLSNIKTLNINSNNNNVNNKYKYQYQYNFPKEKKKRGFRNNFYLFNIKRLTRSSSKS